MSGRRAVLRALRLGLLAWGALGPASARAQLVRREPPELEAALAGRVCHDEDGDGQCAPGEPGLPGVRLVLASGREVLTDERGRYHFTQVDARVPDETGGLHLRPGRQRLRLDTRTLPLDAVPSPEAVTLEVSWGALVTRDFAVRLPRATPRSPGLAYDASPPTARAVPAGVEFLLAGHVAPGDEVTVDAVEASVDAQGHWRASLQLTPGKHVLHQSVRGEDGTLTLGLLRVDVVRREQGLLVIPRSSESLGEVRLPGTRRTPAASGPGALSLALPPGTRVRLSGQEVTVGPEGSAQVPVQLAPGDNPLSLEVVLPGQAPWKVPVRVRAESRDFAVALLDVEAQYSLDDHRVRLRGRGSAHVEARRGPFSLVGELDLQDTDVEALRGRPALDALRPSLPRLERVPDPDRVLPEWADTSVGRTPNPTESRLRLEVRHDVLGRVGLGTYRAREQEGEVGRYDHPLFGPYAELATGAGPVRAGVSAYAGGLADPLHASAALPAYEELRATGGSLYYLGTAPLAEGSEVVRVELRDGVTGLPLSGRTLTRGRDYEVDYLAGRLILARPLSFIAGEPLLRAEPLTAAPEPVLCVEYATLGTASTADTVGGEAWAEWAGGRVSVSAAREPRSGPSYQLLAGHARTTLGAYTLFAEVARSEGVAVRPESFGVSDDGGLSFLRPSSAWAPAGGDAVGVRVRGPGLFGQGSVDASFRRRTAGFSDETHADLQSTHQVSLRIVQPLGSWRLTLLGDDRRLADLRRPFEPGEMGARTLGLALGYEGKGWGVSAQVRDARLLASERPGQGEPLLEGGRTSVGLEGHYQVNDWLRLVASHRQAVSLYGAGLGRVDDSFAAAGVDVTKGDTTLGVRGGWGPRLGPLAWLQGGWKRGEDVYYGAYSVDVDGPDFGARRMVSGARTPLGGGTSAYVEDVATQDLQGMRLGRAVGVERTLFGALNLSARYERGVRAELDVPQALHRDVAGVSGQLLLERLRLGGNLEVRSERGEPERGAPGPVDRLQTVASLSAQLVLREDLTLSGRANLGRTDERVSGREEARLLEGYAALAWRPGPYVLVARYGITRELSPGAGAVFGEREQQVFSVLPAWHLGDRVDLSAGVHVSRSRQDAVEVWVLTGSLRPAVRVVGGLEVAAEVAGRSVATDRESLGSLRGEVAWRVGDGVRVGVGYTVLGFTGTGLPQETGNASSNRLYLRAELAH